MQGFDIPKLSKQEYNDKMKLLHEQKALATKKMKQYRATVTTLKYQIAQMKLNKKAIIQPDKNQLKGQKELFAI